MQTVSATLPEYDAVCVLLEKPFATWNFKDKRDFLRGPKPTPPLDANSATKSKDKVVYVRKFRDLWYTEHKWLTGSQYLNKMFCIPCMMGGLRPGTWNKFGFSDFGNVTRALNKHEWTPEHMRCAVTFTQLKKKLLGNDVFQENSRLCQKYFNEKVQLNKRFMELPVRAVLFMARQDLPFRENYVNGETFKELVENFVSISPVDIQEHFKGIKPLLFEGTNSMLVQNEIIDCIAEFMDERIKKEIELCPFFSIQVDDFTDMVQSSQCSITARYVNFGGKLVERFLGLYDVNPNHTAETMHEFVMGQLSKFADYHPKFIGMSFDGTCVTPSQLDHFQAKIKEEAKHALLLPCSTRSLTLVLQQSCCSISECRRFFAALRGLPEFFRHCSKRSHFADTEISRWATDTNILSHLNYEWTSVKEILNAIINDPTSDHDSVRQGEVFLNKLNDFEFTLLVSIFHDISTLTDELSKVLQSKCFDIGKCLPEIQSTQALLASERNKDSFAKIFDMTSLKTAIPNDLVDAEQQSKLTQGQVFDKYKDLYYNIIDTTSTQLIIRLRDMDHIKFVSLMDPKKIVRYADNFPTLAFTELAQRYPVKNILDYQRLENELKFIYQQNTYTPKNFFECLSDNNDIFSEAYKLSCLIQALPTTHISSDPNFSCFKRIQTHLRNTKAEEQITNLSKISIEKVLVDEITTTEPFYEDIIQKFAALPYRTIDLVCK